MKLETLFANNRAWAQEMTAKDAGFFRRLVQQQSPKYLWIGCSDSRVPANEIVGLLPGELFVHRNVANLVVETDLNCLAVIQYAVEVLKVEHIIVCGHYGCGGVRAAMDNMDIGLVGRWLKPLVALAAGATDADKLCELNVLEQVRHVCALPAVQDAWKAQRPLAVHGWIYSIHDGLLKDLLPTPVSSPR